MLSGLLAIPFAVTLLAQINVNNSSASLSGKTLVTVEDPWTITGLYTFSRSTSAPFAVNSGAAAVTNLDADKLDGQHGSYYTNAANMAAGTLPIARGGTNSGTALTNNQLMKSSGGSIVEAGAMTNGQLLIGSTGASPAVSSLSAGNGITVTNGAGIITIAAGSKSYTPTLVNASSTSEFDAISFTVPASEMADGDVLLIDFAIQVRNSTGGPITPTVKFKWGASSITLSSGSWTNTANTRNMLFHLRCQRVGSDLWVLDTPSGTGVSLPNLNFDNTVSTVAPDAQVMSAPTFSSSQTVKLSVTLASYNATNNFWNTMAARIHRIASS